MPDNNSNNKIQFSVLNANVPDCIDNTVTNLTDQPTKEIGSLISDALYLAFGGVHYSADKKRAKYAAKLEQFKQELQSDVLQIPKEKQIEPSIQIVGQAIEDAKYCMESDELRSMFSSLIASSINRDCVNDVHPSFSSLIKQMSNIDAKMLSCFLESPTFPLAEYRLIISGKTGHISLFRNAVLFGPSEVSLSAKALSISSLCRMGLIEIPDARYMEQDVYNNFLREPTFLSFVETYKSVSTKNVKLEKFICQLTPLGKSFVKVCL